MSEGADTVSKLYASLLLCFLSPSLKHHNKDFPVQCKDLNADISQSESPFLLTDDGLNSLLPSLSFPVSMKEVL